MRSDAVLDALEAATRAIAGELDLDRVLQLTVDRVRGLVHARYAALGIVDATGSIERFITSGISAAARARIGPPPIGHGLLGTIIRDGVSLRLANIAQHPESYGFPANHPPMRSLLGVPVRVGGQPIGNFYLTEKHGAKEFSLDDLQLVELFALHAAIAIQNARLHRQVQELALLDERTRISRDLHDGIVQGLYGISLSLEDVPDLIEASPPEAADRIDRAIDRLNVSIRDIRAFILELGNPEPGTLSSTLVEAALEVSRDSGVDLQLDVADASAVEARVTSETAHELVQIAREALSNVARHSHADHARLSLHLEGRRAVLEIADDGRGFDPRRRARPGHFGIANLRDRANSIGATLTLDSATGEGTRVVVLLPLAGVGRAS